jgi:flagellar motor switch protein FliN
MKIKSVKAVRIPVQVVLGETELTVEEISGLGTGSIIALESLAGEPVDFVAAGKRIAKGEVVVIDEAFGIRLTKIVNEE